MNRRKFFKKSVFSAIGTAGLLKTAQAAESAKSTDNNVQEYDIVVIGSGCAGLTVAIEAADLGAKVVVLEKNVRTVRQHHLCRRQLQRNKHLGPETRRHQRHGRRFLQRFEESLYV